MPGHFSRPDPATLTIGDDPAELAKVSRGLGEAMVGINVDDLDESGCLATRGW